jgi:hypothetical protein
MLWEGVGIFRDCCGQSSWLAIHKLPNPLKAFKVRMYKSGAVMKTALSVRPSVRLYALNKTVTTSNDDTALNPTNCTISSKSFVPYIPLAGFLNQQLIIFYSLCNLLDQIMHNQ